MDKEKNGNDFISELRLSFYRAYNKRSFDYWLDKNTKRNSFLTWQYQEKIYYGIDELRKLWQNENDSKFHAVGRIIN